MGGNSASALNQRQSSGGGYAQGGEASSGDPGPGAAPPEAPQQPARAAEGPPQGAGGQGAAQGLKQRQASMALPGGGPGGGGGSGERRRQMSLAEPGARSSGRSSVGVAGRLSLIPGRGRQASLVEALGCVAQPEEDEEDTEPPPDLTEHEKELLTASWKEIENNVAHVGVITFISLFETHPDVQEVFMPFNGIELEDLKHSKQLRAHALRVMAFVQKAVARLNEPEKLQTLVRDLGRKHVGYGAKRRYVDLIGPQFIQAIRPSLESQWSDEMHEAWSRLFQHLSFVMKGSMLEEERRVKTAAKGR